MNIYDVLVKPEQIHKIHSFLVGFNLLMRVNFKVSCVEKEVIESLKTATGSIVQVAIIEVLYFSRLSPLFFFLQIYHFPEIN